MKTKIQLALLAVAVALLAGCETSGLSTREHGGVSYPGYILNLPPDATGAPAKKITAPIRLAVVQVGEVAPPQAMLQRLAGNSPLIATVIGLPLAGEADERNSYNRTKLTDTNYAARIQSLCQLARTAGADYVFLFGGNVDSWQKENPLRILDATIIGAVLVPGSRVNLEGKGAGALIEAATARPVFFLSAEGKKSALTPDWLADGKTKELQTQLRDELVGKLTDDLLAKLAAQP